MRGAKLHAHFFCASDICSILPTASSAQVLSEFLVYPALESRSHRTGALECVKGGRVALRLTGKMIMKIDLSMTTLPEDGEYLGTFADISEKNVKGKRNNDVRMLHLVVELPKPKGKDLRLTACRDYRLDTKGINALKADVECWRGRALTMEEMAKFDAAEEFFGKAVKVQVFRATESGKPVAKFAHSFTPAAERSTSSSESRD